MQGDEVIARVRGHRYRARVLRDAAGLAEVELLWNLDFDTDARGERAMISTGSLTPFNMASGAMG